MNHSFFAKYGDVSLRPLNRDDTESLRVWRNNAENSRFLAPVPHITPEMQSLWFECYLEDEDYYVFAIDAEKLGFVGSVALYGFAPGEVEFGRALIGHPNARGRGIGYLACVLCLYIGFTKFDVNKIRAFVYKENHAAVGAYKKGGFRIVGERGGDEYVIEVKKDEFFEKHDFLKEVGL